MTVEELELLRSLPLLRKLMNADERKLITRLVNQGLAYKCTSDDKQRSRQYVLSEAGREFINDSTYTD
jgi:hypothetical protein